jgi:hypothetical protein
LTKVSLSIEAIYVPGFQHPVHAETYLRALSDTEWTELRAEATRSRHRGDPALLCGDCRGPVYGRESTAGRRHCYHFGTDIKDCRWAAANASNFRSIDASKFKGNQEGERHKNLKAMICEILELDTHTAEMGVTPERYTKGSEGRYAFPDVFAASWQGAAAAFEIQLATTQLPTITRREDFYAENGIRLCWIVSGDVVQLERRAFKDIYLRNDGQVFAVDGEVLSVARAVGAPRFRLMRLLPGPIRNGLAPIWRQRIVPPDEIDWGQPGDRPKSAESSYDSYLDQLVTRDKEAVRLREQFYAALTECDHEQAGQCWDEITTIVGGAAWSTLGEPYDTVRALGVLATVRRNTISVKTKIDISNLPHLVNSLLLEPKGRRSWSHAFMCLAAAKVTDLLNTPSIAKKLERNLASEQGQPNKEMLAGRAFDVLFPEGAFQRLRLASASQGDDTDKRLEPD